MAKITRIKASDSPREKESDTPTITRKKVVVSDKKTTKKKNEEQRAAEKKLTIAPKSDAKTKSRQKTFILFRPFVALWCYLRDSWRELRQVRWPDRKATWKLVVAVILYSLLFVAIISLLDLFFSWLFNLILNR